MTDADLLSTVKVGSKSFQVVKPVPTQFVKDNWFNPIRLACHRLGIYGIITDELVSFVKELLGKDIKNTIEIGAGNGTFGRALGVPLTDNRMQEWPQISLLYEGMKQPTIKYPRDVLKLNYKEAITVFKPKIVIASWLTQIYKEEDGPSQQSNEFGVDEHWLLDHVDTYILYGNDNTHGTKRIFKDPTVEVTKVHKDFMYSRSQESEKNFLYLIKKKK